MPGAEVSRTDRFERRNRLFSERPFHRLDVQFHGLQDIPHNPHLQEYLYTAGIEISRIEAAHALRARIAHFPEFTFVHAVVPPLTIVWRRDRLSIGRALVLLVRDGGLEFPDGAPVVRREPGAYLVLPGDTPVEITATRPRTEVVYFSVPARFVRGVLDAGEASVSPTPLPSALLAPMYAFAANLCALSLTDIDDFSPLESAAEEIARSTVRLIVGLPERRSPSLFSTAVELILDEYPDRALNSARLAERLKVSSRTVQLAFQAEGTTVSGTIRRVRAAAAARIAREQPELRRARIAELTGFGSVDALERARNAVRRRDHVS